MLDLFANLTDNKYIILLLVNLLFLVIGMLMEANAAVVMMTPLLRPLMLSLGLSDPEMRKPLPEIYPAGAENP